MLETEIKKLREAVEANTAALLGGQSAPKDNVAPAVPAATAPSVPAAVAPAAPAPAANPVAPVVPAVPAPPQPAAQAPVAPPVAPVAPTPAPTTPQMTHIQAQQEIGAVVQALGDAARVQEVMTQYGSPRLNEIPADNLFSLVQSCKALLQS